MPKKTKFRETRSNYDQTFSSDNPGQKTLNRVKRSSKMTHD